jgi:[ribosomal protein S5]-alanine N-acetyltransferase
MQVNTDLPSCILRPWEAGDKPNLLRFANNRSIWRNLLDTFPHPYTEADAQFWLEHTKANFNDLAIQFEGEVVGGVGVIPQQAVARKTAVFGYWLAEPMWGRGIATAAARAMTSYVFETMPLWRLEATVFAWNPASMRVLEKAGFSREGILRKSAFKDGELIDSVMYAKIREASTS